MIKKTTILTALLLCIWFSGKAQGIKLFEGTFSDAKAEAKKENKYLVIDGYTDWCGWCKFMVKNVFPIKEVGDFYNSNFIFLEMNMEQGEGKEIARQYKLQEYPTFLFFDPDGGFVHYFFGASTTGPSFIKLGQTALDSMHNCRGLAYRFFRGEHDTAFLKELIKTISYYADPKITEKALATYWSSITENQILDKENWLMFKYYEADINSIPYNYICNHRSDYLARYHDKQDSNIICLKAVLAIKPAIDNKDDVTFKKARQIALNSSDKQIRYTLCEKELPYYLAKSDLSDLYGDMDQFIKKFGTDWVWALASEMGTGTNDSKILKHALDYASQAMKANKNYANTDTYAHILYKLGRYKEAYASANEAMDLTKNIQDPDERTRDSGQTTELLEQIKKSMAEKN